MVDNKFKNREWIFTFIYAKIVIYCEKNKSVVFYVFLLLFANIGFIKFKKEPIFEGVCVELRASKLEKLM